MKSIEIIVKEQKTKDGKAYKKYLAVKNDGKLIECGFAEDVVKPKKHCIAFIEDDKLFVTKKKNAQGNPILTKDGRTIDKLIIMAIKGYEKQEVIDQMEEDYRAKKTEQLDAMFD